MLSSEFSLLLACLRGAVASGSAGGQELWDAVGQQDIDLKRFLALVRRHRVDGLVWAQMSAAHGSCASSSRSPLTASLREAVLSRLQPRALRFAQQALGHVAAGQRLFAALEAAAVPAVILKGPPLAVWAYGTVGARHSRDLDVLVPEESLAAALACLKAEGYQFVPPHGALWAAAFADPGRRKILLRRSYHLSLFHPQQGVLVELHWRLHANPQLFPLVLSDANRQPPSAETAFLPVLKPDVHLLYLFTHGAAHGWFRLKWLVDVAAVLAQSPQGAARAAELLLQQAAGCGLFWPVAQGLTLAASLLALPLTPTTTERLQQGGRARWLLACAQEAIVGEGQGEELQQHRFAESKIKASRFLLRSGRRYWQDELCYHLFEEELWLRHPWPLSCLSIWRLGRWVARRWRHSEEKAAP